MVKVALYGEQYVVVELSNLSPPKGEMMVRPELTKC